MSAIPSAPNAGLRREARDHVNVRRDHTVPVLTAAEHERCTRELAELRRARDEDLVDLMRQAQSLVTADAGEELGQIHTGQAVATLRIARLEHLLAACEVVHRQPDDETVGLGCTVELEFTRTGVRRRFELVGVGASGSARSITARSPVGQAVLGRAVGDAVMVDLPGGVAEELVIVGVQGGGSTDDSGRSRR